MPTTDEIKQRLKSAWVWQKQLEADLQTLQDLEDLAAKITPVYNFAPGGGGDGDKIGGAVAKLVDLDKDIQNDIKMLTEALAATRALIKMLDDEKLQLILFKRYLNYQRWEVIAADLGYSWRQVHRCHATALKFLEKMS
ncbi:MAG: hypothetical protein U0J27_09155 [Phascolarctobacterium faecium]|uniref:hypothetical protein n=1 Tax=Phascolarctobacterium faecium TaxID=33025 RepID=UPI002E77C083|nr:hypothetical protein [Phascolarctobacterium faecium]MED9992458.1 hypothetical protein [Phascolarctobacterium faecium]